MRTLLVLLVLLSLRCEVAEVIPAVVGAGIMRPPASWSRLSSPVGPRPRRFGTVTPTPRGVVIFGGVGADGELADPWRWHLGAWQPLSLQGAPSARAGHSAVWTGGGLCIWGGARGRRVLQDGACWNPLTDQWRPMSIDEAPVARRRHGAVAVDGRMLVFGGLDEEGEALGDGAIYDPARDGWTALGEGAPRPRADPWLVTHGARVAVLGGVGEALALGADDLGWYDLASSAWQGALVAEGPRAREGALALRWQGSLLALGERAWRFDPQESRWSPLAMDGAPSRRWSATVIEASDGVMVWGGTDGDGALGDGARYVVAEQRWRPVPMAGAPSPRSDAMGFFDGERVLVLWGTVGDRLSEEVWALPWPPGG